MTMFGIEETEIQEMLAELGEPATLPNGVVVHVIPGQLGHAVTQDTGDGPERVLPDGMMSSAVIEQYGIMDGECGTVLTFGNRQKRIVSIVKETDGFSTITFGEV